MVTQVLFLLFRWLHNKSIFDCHFMGNDLAILWIFESDCQKNQH